MWDLNLDLRNELELDIQRVVSDSGPLSGILVTGDIAFSGRPDEYESAAKWLKKLTEIVGCQENDVWIVPGNHDVDWAIVDASPTITEFHDRLRTCSPAEVDGQIQKYLVSDTSGDTYLTPLQNYNGFAARYGCSMSAARPYWEDFLPIGSSGATLRVRGLTTPLISDRNDDSDGRRLVVGSAQTTIPRQLGTITLTMAHHPISWLRDGERVDLALKSRAQVQLWGHRHAHQTRVLDGNVHLFAGAVQPDRGLLEYEPRYSVFEIQADGSGAASLTLYPRVWRRDGQEFGADFDETGASRQTFPVSVDIGHRGTLGQEAEEVVTLDQPHAEAQRDARRTLAFAFTTLPYQRRLALARAMDLIDQSSRDVADQQLFELVLAGALREGKLAELWARVHRASGSTPDTDPFGPFELPEGE